MFKGWRISSCYNQFWLPSNKPNLSGLNRQVLAHPCLPPRRELCHHCCKTSQWSSAGNPWNFWLSQNQLQFLRTSKIDHNTTSWGTYYVCFIRKKSWGIPSHLQREANGTSWHHGFTSLKSNCTLRRSCSPPAERLLRCAIFFEGCTFLR